MKLAKLIGLVFIWRVLITLVAFLAVFLIPLKDGFTPLSNPFTWNQLLSMWSNFDGMHYLELARVGYAQPSTNMMYAFFPIFPWAIRIFNLFDSLLVSGLLVSHLCLILSLILLFKLLKSEFNEKLAQNTILLILIFPTAFFFGSVYTESLFLLISVACFYFLQRRLFLPACLLALLASATRLSGIFLWPAIAIELWELHHRKIKSVFQDLNAVWLLLPPLGLLSYMQFQFLKTGNALFFITSQAGFGANRVVNKLILLHQVFYRYFKMIIFIDHSDPLFFTVLLEFFTAVLFLILIYFVFKRLRLSYAVYCALAYLIPTFTGTFSSLPRYMLVVFPSFIILSQFFLSQPKLARYFYLIFSILVSIISIALFTRGYFIG